MQIKKKQREEEVGGGGDEQREREKCEKREFAYILHSTRAHTGILN